MFGNNNNRKRKDGRLGKLLFAMVLMSVTTISAQTSFSKATKIYLMHSSGNHLERSSNDGGIIVAATKSNPQQMTFIPDGKGYYSIQSGTAAKFLSLSGQWNTTFVADSSQAAAKFAIESSNNYVKLRCKANNKYLGTDKNDSGSSVYADKSGSDIKHLWYFSDKVNALLPVDTLRYIVSPQVVRQHFDGWGVSLCWWAGQCGKWSDKKIDEIVDWLVSPTGLNYSHFRYNIGGGDDPQNRHCTQHHMANGKGLRAEMEGFKDFSGDEYHWDRDAAQRKIMLKIKEKRPDAVFEAFSNSCPYYMTYSGCVSGNTDGGKDNLKPEYYKEFAHYLVDVCKHYKDEYGIEFKTLEPFNESVTGFWYANGPQEGCHFDYTSQIKFVKVLEPILKASGLKTVISASDETNVGLSVGGFQEYQKGGVLSKVGQWNTHTYSGSNVDRAHLASLVRQAGIPLWMSETGSGGSGIGGNLALAQRLIDDMRYIQPEAWIDWQYMEEANDQWCTIRGSFANQTYNKVKNYYVRQQCSRFIKRGYDIVTSLCPQSLAAVSSGRDTLVLVVLNEGAKAVHAIDLSLFSEQPVRTTIKAYRTSESESLASAISSVKVDGDKLTLNMPAQSITTLVIPIASNTPEPDELIADRMEYLIVPRNETMRAVTSTDGKVTIQDIDYGDAQRWQLTHESDGTYSMKNGLGLLLTAHRASNSSSLTAQKSKTSEQGFYIDPLDFPYFKILASRGRTHGLDLSNASTNAGTTITIWQYQDNNAAPTHRQWTLIPMNNRQQTDGIIERHSTPACHQRNTGTWDLTGRRVCDKAPLPKGVFIKNGKKIIIR